MTTETIPEKYQLATYDYPLMESLIAQAPLPNRDQSRLLVLHKKTGVIEHKHFSDLVQYLGPSDVVVLNNTKVFPARLEGRKTEGRGKMGALLLRKNQEPGSWEALIRGAVRCGQHLEFGPQLNAVVGENLGDGRWILRFIPNGNYQGDLDEWLEQAGMPPLPPYIRRDPTPEDRDRYQCVYASKKGSVAAPTAGLHFTQALLKKIRAQGTTVLSVTLHVGRGTFQPVRNDDIRLHRMDSEWYEINPSTAESLEQATRNSRRILAIGTTSTRVLESIGAASGKVSSLSGWTDLFITPGYSFKKVSALITNFHYPKSTLLMLVSSFAGAHNIRRAYSEAMALDYRFLSYGDAMLIL